MIDINSATQIALTGLSGVFGVVGSSLWVKRWVDRTDKKIDSIQDKLTEILVDNATIRERMLSKERCYDDMRREMKSLESHTMKSIGNLSTIMQRQATKGLTDK